MFSTTKHPSRRIPASRASSAAGSEVGNTSAPSSWKLAGDSYTSPAKPKMFGREKPCRSRFSASYLNPTTLRCKYQKYTYIYIIYNLYITIYVYIVTSVFFPLTSYQRKHLDHFMFPKCRIFVAPCFAVQLEDSCFVANHPDQQRSNRP